VDGVHYVGDIEPFFCAFWVYSQPFGAGCNTQHEKLKKTPSSLQQQQNQPQHAQAHPYQLVIQHVLLFNHGIKAH
jgi:hypothetical protein